MRTPISYYGGKQKMVYLILPLIPQHRIYVEPYFGGGSIFWAKGPSFLEVINDINHQVVNFYQVMHDDFDSLLKKVRGSLMAEHLHKEALTIYKHPNDQDRVDKAWAFWYVTNASFTNKPGGVWKFDMGSGGSHSGVLIQRRRNEFEFYRDRLQRVQISCRDALRVIKDRDNEHTFFYLDPPYPGTDQGHYKGYTWEDLENLLNLCEKIKGKFMLSNYPNELITSYAEKNGWYTMEFDMRLSASQKNGMRKKEAIIMNYQPDNKLF